MEQYTHRMLAEEEIRRLFEKYKGKFKSCLEIGAGNYPIKDLLLQYNPDCSYFSIDDESEYKDGRNMKMDAHDMSEFGDRKFDLVFMCHTAEHFIDPITAFKEIYRVLSANGIVISVTPYPCEHQILNGDQNHYFVLTTHQWARVLWSAGFKVYSGIIQDTWKGEKIPIIQDYNIISIGEK